MGYELNIKRAEGQNSITKEEWITYIASDSEFEGIEEFSTNFGEDEVLTLQTPSAGLWKTDKGEVPFTFYEKYGEITVKNPEQWIIEKMIVMANRLNAVVMGEEGEIYDEGYLKDLFSNPFENENSITDKRWWQFWKRNFSIS